MTIKIKLLLSLIISTMLNIGCVPVKPATHKNIWEKTNNFVENKFFTAQILPYYDNDVAPTGRGAIIGYNGLKLAIQNKTNKTLEINWNKTLYIFNNQTSNGFMFVGTSYSKRDNPKSPSIIFPNGSLSKVIWPNSLVNTGQRGSYYNDYMRLGEHGIYLTAVSGGKEINEKLTMKYLRVRK